MCITFWIPKRVKTFGKTSFRKLLISESSAIRESKNSRQNDFYQFHFPSNFRRRKLEIHLAGATFEGSHIVFPLWKGGGMVPFVRPTCSSARIAEEKPIRLADDLVRHTDRAINQSWNVSLVVWKPRSSRVKRCSSTVLLNGCHCCTFAAHACEIDVFLQFALLTFEIKSACCRIVMISDNFIKVILLRAQRWYRNDNFEKASNFVWETLYSGFGFLREKERMIKGKDRWRDRGSLVLFDEE